MRAAGDFLKKRERETGSLISFTYDDMNTYARLCVLDAEINVLENFYAIRSSTGIKTTISTKKEELQQIKTQHDL